MVFSLCADRAAVIGDDGTESAIMFTSPLSQDETLFRSSCKCEITSKNPQQQLDNNLKFVVRRMPRLQNGDGVYYRYGQHQQIVFTAYNQQFLQPELTINAGSHNVVNASIEIENIQELSGHSRIFIHVEPGK